jgi:uncharacterized protein (DUF2235 family)
MAQTTTQNFASPVPYDLNNFNDQIAEERRKARETQFTQLPPKKRLIVCCDGTWQSSNHGIQSIPSNVAKLSRALAKYTQEEDGKVIHQVVFYDAGVGTATDTVTTLAAKASKSHQGAFGEGLDENVCEAYNFLVRL